MEPAEELNSFAYNQHIAGIEHSYRITQNEEKYGIEQDGVIIAELRHDSRWHQLSGAQLDPEVMESICDQIEAHYL
jgi:hypothetical protein